MIIVPNRLTGGHSNNGPLEPLMCGPYFESRWGHWLIPLLTLTSKPKKTPKNPQRSTCKPTSMPFPVASSLQHPCNNNVPVLRLFIPVYVQKNLNKSKLMLANIQIPYWAIRVTDVCHGFQSPRKIVNICTDLTS
jgi:hypothetical protein